MNWKHSFYQIYAITFGQSFTIDEAYRLLKEQHEDRLFSIASAFAETHRAKAKIIDAKASLREFKDTKGIKAHERRSEAAILETEARFIIAQPCLDMARAELAFIENCILFIDAKSACRRVYDDFAIGSQLIQPLEYAYDYTWSLIYEGPHSELMKNIWINPYAQDIINTAKDFKREDCPSREQVAINLAKRLNIEETCLAVSVKIDHGLMSARSALAHYQNAHQVSIAKLETKKNEQLSRTDNTSIGVEGAD